MKNVVLIILSSNLSLSITFAAFKEVQKACCGNGTLNAESAYSPTARVCRNWEEYLFWDQFHPTQAAAKLAVVALFTGSPPLVAPVNFSSVARIYVKLKWIMTFLPIYHPSGVLSVLRWGSNFPSD